MDDQEFTISIISHCREFGGYLTSGSSRYFSLDWGSGLQVKVSKLRVQEIVVEKEVIGPETGEFNVNESALALLNISKRELEVLELMSTGLSNT